MNFLPRFAEIRWLMALIGLLLLWPGPSPAQVQDKAQQGCITSLQKASAKIQKFQGKESYACISAAVVGRESDPSSCISADAKGKVAKASGATQSFFDKKCGTPPDFGIATVAEINQASVYFPKLLLEDVLGADLAAASVDVDRGGGLCQRAVVKGFDKLYQSALKSLLLCQQTALRNGTATDGASLIEPCLAELTADPKGLLASARDKLARDLVKRCGPLDLPTTLPGRCAAEGDSGAVASCIADRVDCRLCQTANETGGTSADCDLFDDGIANSSCTAPASACGNHLLDPGEQCDDGNQVETDFCSSECKAQQWSNPLLILLISFSDSDLNDYHPEAEDGWAGLLFGTGQGQGNHYWNEVFGGNFEVEPVVESSGTPNNGVIHVTVSATQPTSPVVIEDQTWLVDALDQAASFMDFDALDSNGDGILENRELTVMVVPDMELGTTSGAGAQANIRLDHPIAGTDVTLEKFTRTQRYYTSIGVNQHEFGHHFFGLDHFAGVTDHSVMGTGAYAEDTVIEALTCCFGGWGTRPTGPAAFGRYWGGWATPQTPVWSGDTATLTLNSIESGNYNMFRLELPDGYLLIENRTNTGYDRSIPWCDGNQGGIFFHEISQYISNVEIANLVSREASQSFDQDWEVCDIYSLAGRNDAFSYGGYDFSNFSAAGPTMTVDVARNGIAREIQSYKMRWFTKDPIRGDGYRLWHHERIEEGAPLVIDFADMIGGDDPSNGQGLTLTGYYNTGEARSLDKPATWSVSGSYATISKFDISGGDASTVDDAIVRVEFQTSNACESEATVTIEHEGRTLEAQLINLPCNGPTPTPGPTATPGPTPTPGPTATPGPTPTPGPTATPTPTPAPGCNTNPAPEWYDNGDGTATQCATGLVWELKTKDGSIHDWFNSYTWSDGDPWDLDGTVQTDFLDILNDVSGGGANAFAGRTNWRLPSSLELGGVADLAPATGGIVNPEAGDCTGSDAGCTTIPGDTLPTSYWSSTTSSGGNAFAYHTSFSSGTVSHAIKTTALRVRAVSD
jgi:M6 family metalloprotease-like protein